MLLSEPSSYSVDTAITARFIHMIMLLSESSSYPVDTATTARFIHMIKLLSEPSSYSVDTVTTARFIHLIMLLSEPSSYSVNTATTARFIHMIMFQSGPSSYSDDTATIDEFMHTNMFLLGSSSCSVDTAINAEFMRMTMLSPSGPVTSGMPCLTEMAVLFCNVLVLKFLLNNFQIPLRCQFYSSSASVFNTCVFQSIDLILQTKQKNGDGVPLDLTESLKFTMNNENRPPPENF